ncbi:hypothetical protein MMC12_005186 [Toensbergia leucococca]|nr:hypothetical protein [Toensbergia leucococca]
MLNQISFLLILLIPSLLAIPTTPNFNSILGLLDKRTLITCFTQAASSASLHPLKVTDCQDVMTQIIRGGRAQAPMDFSTTAGFVVPYHWKYGTCLVAIDMSDDESDTFPLTAIAASAALIMQVCNDQNHGLGGLSMAGPKGVVRVRVLGIPVPRRKPTPMEVCDLIAPMGTRLGPRDVTSGVPLNCTT